MKFSKLSVGAAVVVAGVSLAGSAFAQDAEGGAAASTSGGGEVGMTLPGAGGGPKAQAAAGDNDHDAMIGHFAVGYLGARTVPFPGGNLQAPVIGLRYWLDQMIGLDAGIGFYNDGGKNTQNNTSQDVASRTAVLIHAGVPLALSQGKHFSFQIVPEVNIGFSSQDEKPPNQEIKRSGSTIQVGARAGGELHFGFMGVPQLSLQGGVGLLFATQTTKTETTAGNTTTTVENSSQVVSTTLNGQPWDIFTTSVAALYYF